MQRNDQIAFRPSPQRRGVILIVVMVLVVMVALAGFGFLVAMSTEYEAARLGGDLLQAQQVMASAETYVLSLAEERADDPAEDDPFASSATGTFAEDQQRQWSARPVRPVESQFADGGNRQGSMRTQRWRFSVVHPLRDDDLATAGQESERDALNAIDIGTTFSADGNASGPVTFGMRDESSRLHLQMVLDQETAIPGEGRRMLMELPGMTLEAADGILDWIDADREPREFGAESREYSQSESSGPRNGIPPVLEELLFVRGVQRSVFYGSSFAAGGFEEEPAAWSEHLTVWSAEANRNARGRRRINVNDRADLTRSSSSGPSEAGDSELAELPEDLLRFIQLGAVYGLVDEPNGSESVLDVDVPKELSDPDFEPIPLESLARLIDASVEMPQDAGGQRIASPLKSADPDFADRFRQLEDSATVESGDVIVGRVNVNLATPSVLRAITGDPAIASRIVMERASLEPEERESTVWLLSKQIVDLSTFRNIHPLITVSGDVSTGEIIVYRRTGGPFLRRRLTIDAAHRPARRLDWTELTERGLPASVLMLIDPASFGTPEL